MSDYQAFVCMLERRGVRYEVQDESNGPRVLVYNWTSAEGEQPEGYCGFWSEWLFGTDGLLLEVSHWE